MDQRVSVVIPAFNGHHFLEASLPLISKLKVREVIIVDDASTDDTVKFIRNNYPKVKIIAHSQNVGFPSSVNDGFKAATSPYVLLLNQDALPKSDILEHSLPLFDSVSNLFAVTFNDSQNSWAKAELNSGFIDYSNGFIKSRHSSYWASGGAGIFNKNIWDTLGGLDLVFSPGYFEDQDIGFRAHKLGFEILWEPKCQIIHSSPGSTFSKKYSSFKLTHIKERNYLLLHWKNLESKNLLIHLFFLVVKILTHPGFIVPTLQAVALIPKLTRTKFTISDASVFKKFSE